MQKLQVAKKYQTIIENADITRISGRVIQIVGLIIESNGPQVRLGDLCLITLPQKEGYIKAEVVGFKDKRIMLMPFDKMEGISPSSEVISTGKSFTIPVGESLKGRIINGLGDPIDGKGKLSCETISSILTHSPHPLTRPRIQEILPLGIKAIDTCLTVGKGQRIGIFSGSGVGKSTLMGMIARFTKADINVIGLIGERGREVRDFIERDLQEEGLKRSVVVVATSDQPALVRLRGAFVATTIAEYFRDRGYDVNLMMDSITRFAWAQREVGLSIGEPPATRGFTPSVFAILPKLLERCGTSHLGSITGLYTILVEADDMNEPVADNVRAILDGHIVLSRDLATKNQYPAIDILQSVSRVMIDIVPPEHEHAARQMRKIIATMRDAEDLINIGAYVKGSNPNIDYALSKIDQVNEFLRQGVLEQTDYNSSVNRLKELFIGIEGIEG